MRAIKKVIQRALGYCGMCGRYFVYPKRRHMSTMYENEESNYITVCADCFEEVEEYWQERWDEYYSERL
jgi:hypothetical protein